MTACRSIAKGPNTLVYITETAEGVKSSLLISILISGHTIS